MVPSALVLVTGLTSAFGNQPGWPRYCGRHVDPSPALVDLDQDQDYEVFFCSLDNFLYGLDRVWAEKGSA